MTKEQFEGIIRELLFAIAGLLVSFNFLAQSHTDTVVAATLAVVVLAWGVRNKQGPAVLMSLIRKAIQTVPPVLVLYAVVTPEQAGALAAVALSITGFWSIQSNKT